MTNEYRLNLSKKNLPELRELYDRQKAIIENKSLVAKLKDKGESVRALCDKIEKEIQHRNDVESLDLSLSNLKIADARTELDKHAKYVCSKDSQVEDSRYRPHRTLIPNERKSLDHSPKKPIEVSSAFEPYLCHKPTQCVSLPESLEIQQQHSRKITEERTKKFLERLRVYEDSDSESEGEPQVEDEDDGDNLIGVNTF
ncbi:uncharacterized protein LOC116176843 [Photinus pyralis]|uniref:Uncharacterized protein n=1 Tax=Photinus pyralis TaxID=7054 RepID=A0A1Y1KKS3_PHOPY|nr:uncharacterized protein LOC116176843 [Photinus pyralis]